MGTRVFQHLCRLLLWKIAHERLMTNTERRHRNMTDCDSCPRCHDAPETVMHSIHDCEEILDYWRIFVHQDHWAKFCSLGLVGWLKWHLLTPNIGNFDVYWPTFFGLSIYALWNDRNILVFSSRSHLHTDLVEAVQSQHEFYSHSTQRTNPFLCRC